VAAALFPGGVAGAFGQEVAEGAFKVGAEAAAFGGVAFGERAAADDFGEEVLGEVLGVLVGGGPGAPDQGIDGFPVELGQAGQFRLAAGGIPVPQDRESGMRGGRQLVGGSADFGESFVHGRMGNPCPIGPAPLQ